MDQENISGMTPTRELVIELRGDMRNLADKIGGLTTVITNIENRRIDPLEKKIDEQAKEIEELKLKAQKKDGEFSGFYKILVFISMIISAYAALKH